MDAQAWGSMAPFQSAYSLYGQWTIPPTLTLGSTAFIASENALTAIPYVLGESAALPCRPVQVVPAAG